MTSEPPAELACSGCPGVTGDPVSDTTVTFEGLGWGCWCHSSRLARYPADLRLVLTAFMAGVYGFFFFVRFAASFCSSQARRRQRLVVCTLHAVDSVDLRLPRINQV